MGGLQKQLGAFFGVKEIGSRIKWAKMKLNLFQMGQVKIQTGKLDGFESRHKWDNLELKWVDLRPIYIGVHEAHIYWRT